MLAATSQSKMPSPVLIIYPWLFSIIHNHLSPSCRAGLRLLLRRSNGFAFDIRRFLYGIDLEEVVEDDEEHGSGAKEDGKTIEIVIRNHLESRF
jgi:hypothetical protein